MSSRAVALLFFVVALVFAPVTVLAQPVVPERSIGDELAGTAKADYAAGKVLFADGNYAGALVKFQSALDDSKDRRLFWNIAACHRGLKHYADTIRYLESYKKEATTITDKDRADADDIIGALRPYVGSITVRATEPNAQVLLDGKPIGQVPLEKFLVDLGDHKVTLKKDGFTDATYAFTAGSSDVVVDLTLAPAAKTGKVSIHAGSGDMITVDGKQLGVGEWEGPMDAGVHTLTVSAPGKKTFDTRFVVDVGQVRPIDVKLEEEKRGLPTWAWIGIGAGSAAVASVVAILLLSGGDDGPTKTEPVRGTIDPPGVVNIPYRPMLTF